MSWVTQPRAPRCFLPAGKPLFGTLVSLLHRGTPVIGIIDQPITRERWVGVAGQPTMLNGRPIKTRHCQDVASAFMYSTTPHMFSGDNEVAWQRVRDAVRIPLYGCDCYAYGLLAAGQVDLVVEADLKVYDYMALVPIVQVTWVTNGTKVPGWWYMPKVQPQAGCCGDVFTAWPPCYAAEAPACRARYACMHHLGRVADLVHVKSVSMPVMWSTHCTA
jgi:inositol-phosphate phosphatase/L-galactose 1-phosphate phosphatase/histidinol-phosphatase